MIFMILIGATVFGYYMTLSRIPQEVVQIVIAMDLNRWVVVIGIVISLVYVTVFFAVARLLIPAFADYCSVDLLTETVARLPHLAVQASGGVASLNDLKTLPTAGVIIGNGSDVGVFTHGENGRELELLVSYGLSPLQALRAATTTDARMLHMENRLGAVKPGLLADLVAQGYSNANVAAPIDAAVSPAVASLARFSCSATRVGGGSSDAGAALRGPTARRRSSRRNGASGKRPAARGGRCPAAPATAAACRRG